MPFGIVGRTGPVMRHVVGFGDRSTGRGTIGANLGIVTDGDILLQRCGPIPKLLWADLLKQLHEQNNKAVINSAEAALIT